MDKLNELLTSETFKTALISSSVIAALISSFITFGFNFFLTNHFKNKDYKLKFNEMILDKRIKTYETLINVIEELFAVVSPTDDLSKSTLGIFINIETLSKYHIKLYNSVMSKFWLSKDISAKLSELNLNLHNIICQVEKETEENKDDMLKSIAELRFQEFRQYRDDMIQVLYNDFSQLHEIESFIKSKGEKFDYLNPSFIKYIEYSPKQ